MSHDSQCLHVGVSRQAASLALERQHGHRNSKAMQWKAPGLAVSFNEWCHHSCSSFDDCIHDESHGVHVECGKGQKGHHRRG